MRNKTIHTEIEEGGEYLQRCLFYKEGPLPLETALGKTIVGDMARVLPALPEESVDLLIADPPYNRTTSFNGTVFSRKKEAMYEDYTRKWLMTVKPVLKKTATLYVCCDWESSLTLGRVLKELFHVRNRITWQREKGRGAQTNWKNGMEDIWFATNGNRYTFNVDAVRLRKKVNAPYRVNGRPKDWHETENGGYRDTCPSNFWDDLTVPFWSMAENTAHPTQKPEKLFAKLILASSNPGDVVLDPFLGSGTTSVVAKKLGRRYIGIELEPRYCVWAEQRLETADADPGIQGYENGVFWERNSGRGPSALS